MYAATAVHSRESPVRVLSYSRDFGFTAQASSESGPSGKQGSMGRLGQ
jgi:hypothetical protein